MPVSPVSKGHIHATTHSQRSGGGVRERSSQRPGPAGTGETFWDQHTTFLNSVNIFEGVHILSSFAKD